MADFFPAPAYCFIVSIDKNMEGAAAFQEVSGLDAEMDVEEVPAGGVNNFVYRLPKRTKFNNLVLKRGFLKKNSKIFRLVKKNLLSASNLDELKDGNSEGYTIKELTVTLRNEKQEGLITWKFQKAYPVKFSMSNLNAQENSIAVETIEFAHQGFDIEKE